jgi:hypothetical protein
MRCRHIKARSHCARRRRRGVTNEYSKGNLTGKSDVVLVYIMADDCEEQLLLVSYHHRKRDKRKLKKMPYI